MEKKTKRFNKKIDNLAKTKLEFRGAMLVNIILIAILFVSSIFLFWAASAIRVEKRKLIMKYDEKSDVSYEVNLKKNDFYQSPKLGMNQQYPAAAIDGIKVRYDYDFTTDVVGNYQYKYFTVADMVINNVNTIVGENPLLLTRTYQLNQTTSGSLTDDTFNLTREYSIDYATYRNFVMKYKSTYGLNVDAYLKVSMHVEVIDEYSGEIVNTSKVMNVNIPLASNPLMITIDNPDDISGQIFDEHTSTTISTYFIFFAVISLLSSILLFIQEVRKIVKSERAQTRYMNRLNKIISANSDVIVRVKNRINLKDHNIIEVESIEALLDAQNELHIPIAYFETKSNEEGYFVIVNGEEVWRYKFSLEEEK